MWERSGFLATWMEGLLEDSREKFVKTERELVNND